VYSEQKRIQEQAQRIAREAAEARAFTAQKEEERRIATMREIERRYGKSAHRSLPQHEHQQVEHESRLRDERRQAEALARARKMQAGEQIDEAESPIYFKVRRRHQQEAEALTGVRKDEAYEKTQWEARIAAWRTEREAILKRELSK
jgi:hypothetical protein